jgi:class 3 adenylate cyclase/DNA-binding response OmpR family regulator
MDDPISVLLIDDQSIIGEAVRRMLAPEQDIVFHYCSDPIQALKVAKVCHPTVILQDLVMPQMDGLLLVRFLRSRDAPTYQIPLIVLSSKEEPMVKAQAFELGANDYLVKLPDRVELIARIRYHSRAYTNLLKRQEAEALLRDENVRQALYIEQVDKLTQAAFTVEQDTFQPESLSDVVDRGDELGQLARVFTQMVKTVKAREKELLDANAQTRGLKDSYARFFPSEYLQFLRKDSVTEVQLGDYVSKTMAVMFSDIRSFTNLSESMTPQENFNFVNAYLKRVSPEIRNHYGIIVKFLGDGMMAVFPEGADDAVKAGIAKQKRVQEYNEDRLAGGGLPIQVGIGIHVGHMMLGMVGEDNRIQGDAYSDNVNLTARLEGLTKFYGVSMLISGQTLEHLSNPAQYQIRFLDRASVKGRNEPIAVYEVLDAENEEICNLKLQTQADFEQGVSCYRDRALTDAKACFERVLAVNPLDKTAKLYVERVEWLLEHGVPENWNEAWVFSEK